MKNRLLTILLILLTSLTFAQQKDWQWLRQFGGVYSVPQTGNDDEIKDIEVDDEGSAYVFVKVLGDFHYADTVIPFPSHPESKYVFMKFDCNGELKWIYKYDNQLGTNDIVEYDDNHFLVTVRDSLILFNKNGYKRTLHRGDIRQIYCTVDDKKQVYCISQNIDNTDYGGGNIYNSVDTLYLSKHDSLGNIIFFKPLIHSISGGAVAYQTLISVDKASNLYITGQTSINSKFHTIGGDTVDGSTGFAGIELFMIKIDSTGNHIWTKQTRNVGELKGYEYDKSNDHHILNVGFNTFFNGDSMNIRPGLIHNIMVLDTGANVLFNDQYGENSLANSAEGVSYYEDKITFTYNCLYNVPQRIMPYGSKVTQIDSPAVVAPAFATFDTTLKDGVEDDHLHLVSPQGKSPSGRSVTYDNAGNLFMGKRTPVPITFNDSTSPFVGGGYDVFIAKWGTDTCPGAVCPAPTQLASTTITDTSAQLNWTSNESSWNIEYGQQGFTQGTVISNLTQTNHTLTSLQPSTNYEFYVQTNCSANDQSQWSGPVSFTTGNSPCTSPSSLAANNVTDQGATLSWQSSVPAQDLDHFVVEWGTQGFSPGFGDTAQVTGSSYTVSNLDPDKDYEFYVFTVCNSGQSPLAGPGSFTTLTTGLAEQHRDKLKVYPNPAENGFYVMSKQTTNSIITVYNVTGSVVYEKDLTSTLGPVLVPTSDWPGGMYVVQLKKNEEILESERVVVR